MNQLKHSANLTAFLDTIAFAEGTFGRGDDGYNVLFGGKLFSDYSKHPNILTPFTDKSGKVNKSSAAGRYQLLHRYWVAYCKMLHRVDFGKETQDLIAIRQIYECNALGEVEAGNFAFACEKLKRIWASFPGAGYNQRELKYTVLRDFYLKRGGSISNVGK